MSDDYRPPCDRCAAPARWSVANLEQDRHDQDLDHPVIRWFACGRHLHAVLDAAPWRLDVVHLYDLNDLGGAA